jgi:SAM-dependent methyltransferase
LSDFTNCIFHCASVDNIPLEDASMDFGYSLGVLHHVPDTQAGIDACVKKLKPGAPFLLYLYYSFDNRSRLFSFIWKISNYLRFMVSRFPFRLRYLATQVIAFIVYFPLAKFAKLMDKLGFNVTSFPLSSYRNLSFYTMRTDSLDRFGTRLEQRFSRAQIQSMLEKAGLERVVFSEKEPFWCAVGFRSFYHTIS